MKKPHPCFVRHILMFTVTLVVFLIWFPSTISNYPQVEDGMIDLSRWDLKSGSRIPLSGDWELHRIDSRSAIYRLKVKLPETKSVFGLRINLVSKFYKVYINDRLLVQNPNAAALQRESAPPSRPETIFFVPPAKEFDVVVHASGYPYALFGTWFDIDLGPADEMRRYKSYLEYRDGIVIGALAVMMLYFFFYSFLFRKEGINFSFILMCLILIVHTSLHENCLILQLFPGIPFRWFVWLSYLTLIWYPVILYGMNRFHIGNTKRKFSKPFHFYAVSATAITGIIPVSIYAQWAAAFHAIAIVIFITALVDAFFAHTKRVPGMNFTLISSFILGTAGLHDIFFQTGLIPSRFEELTPISIIIFILLVSLVMADRFLKTNHEIQLLSRELNEKLRLEKDLTDRLHTLDTMKEEFLTNSSDSLRTPIDGIINITQSILRGIDGQMNTIQKQNLETILNSARKLQNLIDNLSDISLLQSGGVRIVPAPLEIQTLISNMLVVFRHQKKKESVMLFSAIPPDFPPVLADEFRLRQILNCLLENSLKYTETGTIVVSASHDGEWARICVKDTRIGLQSEMQENLFNTFEQANGVLKWNDKDPGLNLYVTRQLVELHGGKIWSTSELGRGSQACFTLPLSQDRKREDPVSAPKTKVVNFLKPASKENDVPCSILAVDDDTPSLQALANTLQLAQFNVKGVTSGKEALQILESGASYDLVILNSILPELSGFETLELLREKYNRMELPVLMLIQKSRGEDVSLCFKLGANDCLIKPIDVDELMARVNSLVKLKKAANKLIATEILLLQAQIKPHFIQNALSVISSLSVKDPPKAKALILDLSDYLRGSFDLNHNGKGLTTLSKELEMVRAYLAIEQARFKERLQVHFQLLEDLDCALPLLTIQPLVENAVRHGIMHRLEGGEIYITTEREQDRIRIEVRDNGVGIEQELIAKFYELKHDQSGIGIVNIHRRLIIHYGEGLHFQSAPGQGTTVSFYVPWNSDKEVHQ